MSGHMAPYPETDADFEAIEMAVMETERGRTFLREFARRNRHADTQVLLTALSRIERSIEIRQEPSGIDQFRGDLVEMSSAIAKTKREIAAITSSNPQQAPLVEASCELDAIVSATENATSDILAAAEIIQEAGFTLREAGGNVDLCDALNEQATRIYTSCSFQDLTAQRTRKVIDALGFLETRINAMVDIWAFAPDNPDEKEDIVVPGNGLARHRVMSQADVDFVLVEGPSEAPIFAHEPHENASCVSESMPVAQERPETSEFSDEILFSRDHALAVLSEFAGMDSLERAPIRLVQSHASPTPTGIDAALSKARSGLALSAEEAERALDILKAMSVEERTILFS